MKLVVEQPIELILHFEQQNVVMITTRRAVEQDHHRQEGKFQQGPSHNVSTRLFHLLLKFHDFFSRLSARYLYTAVSSWVEVDFMLCNSSVKST